VRVDPIKPTLKAPGAKRLKLNCDILLSTSAFKLKLRRYDKASSREERLMAKKKVIDNSQIVSKSKQSKAEKAGP